MYVSPVLSSLDMMRVFVNVKSSTEYHQGLRGERVFTFGRGSKYLVLSVLVHGLLLVEAGEASVVPLVELPRVLDRDVHLHTNTTHT